jgi:D-threonate/D-erythronate kinase
MPKILIIADDLTGAADCGAVFAECGMQATVVLNRPGEGSATRYPVTSPEVLAIDADTRSHGPEQASEKVARIVDRFGSSVLLFKKVDSTLRGNVAAELAGVLHARRATAAAGERIAILFAPAFPAQGRTTIHGRQMVNGRPLQHTDLGRPEHASSPARLDGMFAEAGLSSGWIELARVRAGAGPLKSAVQRMADQMDVLVFDAETDDDLHAIANAGIALGSNMIWAGSAGLARHIPDAAGFARDSYAMTRAKPQVDGPALFVVGSPAPVSCRQADELAAAPDLAAFTLSADAFSDGGTKYTGVITERLERGDDVLVRFDSSQVSAQHEPRALARALGVLLQPCAKQLGTLLATGGETARAILDAWAVGNLRLLGEVEPGLPYSVGECGDRTLLILTKAGGFGGADTWLRCRDFVRELGIDREAAGIPAAGGKS